jgi:nucleoid DNA-binding protein
MPDPSQILSEQYRQLNRLSGDLISGNFSTSPEYKRAPSFARSSISSDSAFALAPGQFSADPGLYDMDKVAAQSTFTDMWNSFRRGVNETQKGIGQNDYYLAANRIAQLEGGVKTEGELQRLEKAHQSGSLDDITYMNQRSKLVDELESAYKDLNKAKHSILEDESDLSSYPVKKSYQLKEQLIQSAGNDASFLDQLKYTTPSTAGSSAATLGATFTSQLAGNLAKKAIARTAGAWMAGPEAGIVANVVGVAVTLGELLFARTLESKAEVGGQIEQDFQTLKDEYLQKSRKTADQLTKAEINDLMIQANKGAEDMMWKNMSLAAMDAVQSALLWGAGKYLPTGLTKAFNTSKGTRAAGLVGSLYGTSKLEEVEEGLQYAFGTRKSEEALNSVTKQDSYYNKTFIERLGTDYSDVLGSLDVGMFKGDGRYSGNKEFEFATQSGFVLGALMGGAGTSFRMSADLYNYREANKAAREAGLHDTEGDINKLEAQLIQSFIDPKVKGSPRGAFINADTEDRVFYLKQAIKGLARSKDEEGNPRLPKQAAESLLAKIDSAYDKYVKVNAHLENIYSGWKKDTKLEIQKSLFKQSLYTSLYQLDERKKELTAAQTKHAEALLGMDLATANAVDLETKLELLRNSLDEAEGADYKKHIQDLINEYEDQLETQASILGPVVLPPASIELLDANKELLAQQIFKNATQGKVDKMMKVKSRRDLTTFFKDFVDDTEAAPSEDDLAVFDQDRKNNPFQTLANESRAERTAKNKELAKKFGFNDKFTLSLTEEDLDSLINEEIADQLNDTTTYSDRNSELITAGLGDISKLKDLLSTSKKFARWFSNTFNIPDVSAVTQKDFVDAVAMAKALVVKRRIDEKKNKVRKPIEGFIPGNYQSAGRTKAVEDERTEDDLKREFNVKAGRMSQKDALNAIIASKFATPVEKEFARELLRLTTDTDFIAVKALEAPGEYDPNTNEVFIDLRFVSDDYINQEHAVEAAILHELTHKYTVLQVKSNPELLENLDALYAEVQSKAKENKLDGVFYGFKNQYEMLAEVFSNPEFREALKKLQVSDNYVNKYGKTKNLLDGLSKFITFVLNSLGININNSALEQVLSFTATVLETQTETEAQLTAKAFQLFKNKLDTFLKTLDLSKPSKEIIPVIIKHAASLRTNSDITSYIKTKEQNTTLSKLIEEHVNDVMGNILAKEQIVFGEHQLKKGDNIVFLENDKKHFVAAKVVDLLVDPVSGDVLRVNILNPTGEAVTRKISNPEVIEAGAFNTFGEAVQHAKDRTAELTEDTEEEEEIEETYNYFFKAGSPLKTINQPLVQGKENTNPSYVLYQAVLSNLSKDFSDETLPAEFPYMGVMVADGTDPIIFPDGKSYTLPHDLVTLEAVRDGKAKWSTVIVLTDKTGAPVLFGQDGKPSTGGSIVVMNMETANTLSQRVADPETLMAIARNLGLYNGKNLDLKAAREVLLTQTAALIEVRSKIKPGTVMPIPLTRLTAGILLTTAKPNDSLANYKASDLTVDVAEKPINEKTNKGFLTNHPEFKAVVGQPVLIINESPVKLVSRTVSEELVNELLELLDFIDDKEDAVKDQIYTYIRSLVYLPKQANFAGGAIIIGEGETKVILRGDERIKYLSELKYNLLPRLANSIITTFKVQGGLPVMGKMNYNDHIKANFQTYVVFKANGPEAVNMYFGYELTSPLDVSEESYEVELPETQTKLDTKASKTVLAFFAEAFGLPQYTGSVTQKGVKAWLETASPEIKQVGEGVLALLKTPTKAIKYIKTEIEAKRYSSTQPTSTSSTPVSTAPSAKAAMASKLKGRKMGMYFVVIESPESQMDRMLSSKTIKKTCN